MNGPAARISPSSDLYELTRCATMGPRGLSLDYINSCFGRMRAFPASARLRRLTTAPGEARGAAKYVQVTGVHGVTLTFLNTADRDAFVTMMASVVEGAPWVAARAYDRRPFASVAALHASMIGIIRAASPHDQLALLRGHPELGNASGLSATCAREQGAAGLDRLDAADRRRLRDLNRIYRVRFGFPFLLAVRGCTAESVFNALTSRIDATYESEFAEAMRQITQIVHFRLESLVDA